jgi:hypothetical protein
MAQQILYVSVVTRSTDENTSKDKKTYYTRLQIPIDWSQLPTIEHPDIYNLIYMESLKFWVWMVISSMKFPFLSEHTESSILCMTFDEKEMIVAEECDTLVQIYNNGKTIENQYTRSTTYNTHNNILYIHDIFFSKCQSNNKTNNASIETSDNDTRIARSVDGNDNKNDNNVEISDNNSDNSSNSKTKNSDRSIEEQLFDPNWSILSNESMDYRYDGNEVDIDFFNCLN